MPLSEGEAEYRKKFFTETGKTPEQEGRDSAFLLGLGCLWVLFVCFVVAIGLVVYYW